MSERENEDLEPVDVDEADAELLPDREVMSVIGDPSGWRLPPILDTDPGATLPVEPSATE